MIGTHGAAFFAALNTHRGFISYFRQIFDKVETVYVIKGGSGTGKSRFMREISAVAKEKGYRVQEFLCSSDPSSLDGIIIEDIDVAVLDGTAPHIHEPTLIGARERFVDLSVFLDTDSLKGQKEAIQSLQLKKSNEYEKIYKYLKINALYQEMINAVLKKTLIDEKMENAVIRLISGIENDGKAEKTVRIRSSVGCEGCVTVRSYSQMAKKRYSISDLHGLGGVFLKKILDKTDKTFTSVTVSYSPLNPDLPDALYYPKSDIALYIGSEEAQDEIPINIRRFVCDRDLRPYKAEIRALSRLKKDAWDVMMLSFSKIKTLHAELERIYSGAMDFSSKEKFTEEFKKGLIP